MVEFKNYFHSILNANGFKEWKDGFNRDNIPKSTLDKSYFMSYSINTVENGITMEDNINVTLETFFKGYRDPQTAIDNAMELMNTVRLEILDPETIASFVDVNLLGIDSVSQTPTPLNTSNDNSIIITTEFNVRLIQINC